MNYRFHAARTFWKSFKKLPEQQQASARAAFKIFKANPFDPLLRAHKINSLSAYYKQTIYAVVIEGDLRAIFMWRAAKFSRSILAATRSTAFSES